jgi:AraC-like DNA-binding protein
VSAAHDAQSASLDPASGGALCYTAESDPLSDVLRTVRLRGALFFLVDATTPWCVDVPAARHFADIILPSARHVVSYHVAVEGTGLAGVPGMAETQFGAGDIIVFPHGDPYVMASDRGVVPELDRAATIQFFRDLAAGRLPFVIPEGGGGAPRAKFICGFLGCDFTPYNPVLAALPRCLRVGRQDRTGRDLLDQLVELTMNEAQIHRPGVQSIRLGLSELMFIEVIRRHMETLSTDRPSWLTGLRDPIVGCALRKLHADPARDWTLEHLATETGTSRSVLAERFSTTVGEPPMRYLTLWRMQLAARLLADGNDKVSAISEQVGFGSEAAFSRAFKAAMGCPPGRWRSTSRRCAGTAFEAATPI